MKFAKAHSLGNDFLLVEERGLGRKVDRGKLARVLCDRHFGLGADGLVLFRVEEGSRFSMKIFNQDGSEAEISGNGLRCLGAYLRLSGRAREELMLVETGSGTRLLELVEAEEPRFVFKASMGAPRLSSREIPFQVEPPLDRVVSVPLEVGGRDFRITAVSMGNPHCVVFVERLDLAALRELGPKIETHPRFPRKTNVGFVEVRNRSELSVGIWERGVGMTGSSGTGAAAAAVAAILNDKADESLAVYFPAGSLEVLWEERKEIYVTGEAVVVAEGDYLGEIS